MSKILLQFLLLSIYTLSLSAQEIQNASNNWYFGDKAGLDFNTSPPTVLIDGLLNTQEGVASISDINGELLFYTDGLTVWDRTHQAMPNANGTLHGHWSSTQSAIIVPNLSDPDIYYIFTTDELGGSFGLSYTSIDMSLQGNGSVSSPLGNVINGELNIPLVTPVTEKVTGVLKSDYSGYWIIAHGWNNNRFYAYEVSCSGITTEPVISDIGNVHAGDPINNVGYMKATVDGERLALVNRNSGTIDVYDFDNETGVVSNELEIKPNDPLIYGVEFSFDGDYLFIGGKNIISRYTMSSGVLMNIQIDEPSELNNANVVRALQLGPDKNIYVSVRNLKYISAIYNPEDNAPLLTVNAIHLDPDGMGRNCRFGLPNIFYFDLFPPDSIDLIACPNSQVEYNGEFYLAGTTNEVNFVGANGCDSTVILTVETFDTFDELLEVKTCEGSFYDYNGNQILAGTQETFTFLDSNGCDSVITVMVQALVGSMDSLEVNACEGSFYDFNGNQILAGTQETFTFSDSNGCDSTITVMVNELIAPTAIANVSDTLTCNTINVTISGSDSNGNGTVLYDWRFSGNAISINEDITVSIPGIYTLIITDSDNGCTDQTQVEVMQNIENPTAVANTSGLITCSEASVTLLGEASSGNGSLSYNWQDADGITIGTNPNIEVDFPGVYTLVVTDNVNGCSAIDSTTVSGDNGSSLGNFVFLDNNENGIQDQGEPGVSNVYIQLFSEGTDGVLYTNDDFQEDIQMTNNYGYYSFSCIDPGVYYIKFSVNTNTYSFSLPYQGNNTELDSDADLLTGTTEPIVVSLNMPENVSYDAGIYYECDDYTYGGTIGQNQIICPGDTPEPLHTIVPPSGGSGTPEYLWLKSTFPYTTWVEIPNSTTESYDPGPLYLSTIFVRCIRRESCSSFIIESENQATITVLSDEDDYCTGGIVEPPNEEETFIIRQNQSYKVFPNPVSNKLRIEVYSTNHSTSSLYLYNTTGQLISFSKIEADETSKQIDMKDLKAGLYFLHIQEAKNKNHSIIKIVKK